MPSPADDVRVRIRLDAEEAKRTQRGLDDGFRRTAKAAGGVGSALLGGLARVTGLVGAGAVAFQAASTATGGIIGEAPARIGATLSETLRGARQLIDPDAEAAFDPGVIRRTAMTRALRAAGAMLGPAGASESAIENLAAALFEIERRRAETEARTQHAIDRMLTLVAGTTPDTIRTGPGR